MFAQPLRTIRHINIYVLVKLPSAGSYTIVWTRKNTAHTSSTLENTMQGLPEGQGNGKQSHMQFVSKKTQVYYLHKNMNAEEETHMKCEIS